MSSHWMKRITNAGIFALEVAFQVFVNLFPWIFRFLPEFWDKNIPWANDTKHIIYQQKVALLKLLNKDEKLDAHTGIDLWCNTFLYTQIFPWKKFSRFYALFIVKQPFKWKGLYHSSLVAGKWIKWNRPHPSLIKIFSAYEWEKCVCNQIILGALMLPATDI